MHGVKNSGAVACTHNRFSELKAWRDGHAFLIETWGGKTRDTHTIFIYKIIIIYLFPRLLALLSQNKKQKSKSKK